MAEKDGTRKPLGAPRKEGEHDAAEDRMEDWYREELVEFEEGEVVRGRVVQVGASEVLIDVGYKSEGSIPIEEFQRSGLLPKVGDEIEVYLEAKEDNEGLIVLSKDKADKIKVWDVVSRAHERGTPVEGRVVEVVKGGLAVDVGVKAFLPGSQVDLRPVKNLASMLGQTIRAKVIKLNRRRGNVVLSRRAVLEEEREEKKKHTLEVLQEGMALTGTVKNITDYGAFIDLGGIDGLLHVTDMSWGRVGHPSEIFQVGDQVEVVVLHFDRESGRVSLGYKQKSSDPWETVETRYAPGTRAAGKVVSLTNYGAFVELEPGVEGLVHVSEMSWTRRVRHPSKLVSVGDTVDVIVLDVNRASKRISLGMKQVEPDPWATIEERYRPGSRMPGKVRNLTDFGAFVELEPGVDGLLHISQMSNRPIGRPDEIVSVGDELTLLVIRVDSNERRIGLSLKELAHAIEPPKVGDERTTHGRRGKKGKHRDDYEYDDDN
ncbi:MAG: 30S ribosomal protein S1 [Candidatus Rokuibacteriota bacterium]|nr:MAG: 30S ribosomal protein S1 [Candidatus Rokubacteria bacterium]